MSLVPLREQDVAIGAALPWPVFDEERNLLMPAGATLESPEHLQVLLGCRPVREDSSETEPPAGNAQIEGRAGSGFNLRDRFRFEEIGLSVGDLLHMGSPAATGRDSYSVQLLGYLQDKGLMITVPSNKTGPMRLNVGDEVRLRAFSNQRAYQFSCSVKMLCRMPFPYVHLTFPPEVHGVRVRNTPRVRVRIIASAGNNSANAGGAAVFCLISNLSEGGAMIESPAVLGASGDSLQLSFQVHFEDTSVRVSTSALIRSVMPAEAGEPADKDAAMNRYGLQFSELSPGERMNLRAFLYRTMLYNRKARM